MNPSALRRLWMSSLLAGCILLFSSCASTNIPRRDPVGQIFPNVAGTSLAGKEYGLPRDFQGRPVLALVGYEQNAQFDIDRWLMGLQMYDTPITVYELPAAKGMVPRMISGKIDNGMRSGIPREDWPAVVTLYGKSADRLVYFTGNQDSLNSRVMLLDRNGKIVWFHDRGFSASKMEELDAAARRLTE